jgi:hypothetical protein
MPQPPPGDFCDYVLNWKRAGKLDLFIYPDSTQDVGVFAIDIVEHLAQADAPVPDDVAAALGLPVGSSYP